MYYRRKILLSLISAFGEKGLAKIKLQKLLFLFCQQQEKPVFDFVPYKYGCFSFQATKDLKVLQSHYQLIKEEKNQWFIHEPFQGKLKAKEQQRLNHLIKQFEEKTNAETVSYVYDRYPYYSVRSKWEMTSRQKAQVHKEQRNIKTNHQTRLFTIGYQGKSIDAYLNTLIKNNISLLCDVRKNPLSMKYGFSKNQLKKYCASLAIDYVHIPELGIESNKRQNLNSREDYLSLFASYKTTLPDRQQGLNRVLQLLQKHKRIALTCFEKQHQECHRHCVSDYLQGKYQLECSHL